jgi:hypothetical protein
LPFPLSGQHGAIPLHFEPAVAGVRPEWIVVIMLIGFSLRDYRSVHSMTASFTIESCLEQSLQVMVLPVFESKAQVFGALRKTYRAKRRSFQ